MSVTKGAGATARIPGQKQHLSRKSAALRQIHAAIDLFHEEDYASAITLALAAESQLPTPTTDAPYLLKQLRTRVSGDDVAMFNHVRNWLKHDDAGPDEIDIFEFDVVIALMRATTKFIALHRQTSRKMEDFVDWTRTAGFLKAPKGARPPLSAEEI